MTSPEGAGPIRADYHLGLAGRRRTVLSGFREVGGASLNERIIHRVFEVGIVLKAVHGIIECVSGIVLYLVSTTTIIGLVQSITQSELVEDPKDVVANYLLTMAHGFSLSTKSFYAFYLLSHGIVKLALAAGLLANRLWAYPASLIVLALFIVYQVYRFSYTYAPGLVVLTVFDIVIIWLVWHEYRIMRQVHEGR